MNESEVMITTKALAARWATSAGRICNLRSSGRGPAFLKIGEAVRYRLSDVVRYEDARVVNNVESLAAA